MRGGEVGKLLKVVRVVKVVKLLAGQPKLKDTLPVGKVALKPLKVETLQPPRAAKQLSNLRRAGNPSNSRLTFAEHLWNDRQLSTTPPRKPQATFQPFNQLSLAEHVCPATTFQPFNSPCGTPSNFPTFQQALRNGLPTFQPFNRSCGTPGQLFNYPAEPQATFQPFNSPCGTPTFQPPRGTPSNFPTFQQPCGTPCQLSNLPRTHFAHNNLFPIFQPLNNSILQ